MIAKGRVNMRLETAEHPSSQSEERRFYEHDGGQPSLMTPARRAALMAASAVAMAVAAALLVLGWTIRSRVAALAIGVAGPGAALTVMTQLERAPTPAPLYLGVATAGLLAILASAGLARGWRASTRRARRGVEADAP